MKATVTEVILINSEALENDMLVVNGYDIKGIERTWHIEAYKLARALEALRRYKIKKSKIEVKEG